VGVEPKKNQPRISANKRQSHFPYVRVLCSGLSPTQESHPHLKNAIGKTRVRVFLLFHYFFDYTQRQVYGEKNRHAGFSQHFSRRRAIPA
jgi:hypothetical protein